jgi:protein-S-isoprenylcysteine O-methyltransferase Ste14
MRKGAAAVGSAVFFVAAPGVVTGLVPWWITGWRQGGPYPLPVRAISWVVQICAAAVLVHAFVRFVVQGLGTPAPVAPTQQLVVSGAYRFVRNPMYLVVTLLVVTQALILGRPVLLGYAALVQAVTAIFVRGYEEPALRRKFGSEYEAYQRAVPAWLPRTRPYRDPGG